MPKYRKWLLSLGLAAALPTTGFAAGPFNLFNGNSSQPAAQSAPASESEKAANQQTAKQIAYALKRGNLTLRGVKIRFDKGVASLTGSVLDHRQKAAATAMIQRVPGVRVVDNRMTVMQTARAASPAPGSISDSAVQPAAASSANPNEAVARKIASSLQQAGLTGFKIRIGYNDGVAHLQGTVTDQRQWDAVQKTVQSVSEVQKINNQIAVGTAPNAGMRAGGPGPMAQRGMDPRAALFASQQQAMQARAASMQGGGIPPRPAGPLVPPSSQGMVPPGPAPQYAHGGPGSSMPTYSQPNLPSHAWPSYAAYPNSAAITYPTQYSASAWPYIGPFYPYPQVPLGWRKAELEWDDGQWALKFNSKTDRWWWFMNPENWGD